MNLTGKGLVEFCRNNLGIPYVYGCKMEILTKSKFTYLQNKYGKSYVWDSDKNKIGKLCCDCSGFISAYTKKQLGSSQYYSSAKEIHSITKIEDAPIGVLVWMKGHIGVFTGYKNGIPYYAAEDGSAYGSREVPLSYNNFTHWLVMDNFEYDYTSAYKHPFKTKGDDEMVESKPMFIDGKEYSNIKQINKGDSVYVAVSDLKTAGYDVGWNSQIKRVSMRKKTEKINIEIESNNEKKNKKINSVLINGSNYCKMRDLVDIIAEELKKEGFNITIGYNDITKTPSISVK